MTDNAHLIISLIDEIMRMRGRIQSLGPRFADPEDPSGPLMTVLTVIVHAPHTSTVPQIGRSLGHPRQTIQHRAEELVRRGLAEFADNPDHKRAQRLVPTEAGRAIEQRIHARSLEWAAEFAAAMDTDRLKTTVDTLHSVRAGLEAQIRNLSADGDR